MTRTRAEAAPPIQVDREHRVQFELLQALEAALAGAGGCVGPDELLEQYIAYSELHFMSEQLLMRLYAYPEHDDHSREHDLLVEAMQDMRRLRDEADAAALRQALAAQKTRLVEHLRSRDRAFERFLQEQAGR